MNVSNGKCIRDLSRKSLRANRTRNLIAVLAIALTTVLFTSLFTIATVSYTHLLVHLVDLLQRQEREHAQALEHVAVAYVAPVLLSLIHIY